MQLKLAHTVDLFILRTTFLHHPAARLGACTTRIALTSWCVVNHCFEKLHFLSPYKTNFQIYPRTLAAAVVPLGQ